MNKNIAKITKFDFEIEFVLVGLKTELLDFSLLWKRGSKLFIFVFNN